MPYSEEELMDKVNTLVGKVEMPPLVEASDDEGKTAATTSKLPKKKEQM